jgi:hypothetical protein
LGDPREYFGSMPHDELPDEVRRLLDERSAA